MRLGLCATAISCIGIAGFVGMSPTGNDVDPAGSGLPDGIDRAGSALCGTIGVVDGAGVCAFRHSDASSKASAIIAAMIRMGVVFMGCCRSSMQVSLTKIENIEFVNLPPPTCAGGGEVYSRPACSST